MALRRLVLIRHGETEGESSVRFHGSCDVDLSQEGRARMRQIGAELRHQPVDLFVASDRRRSWRGAMLVGRGRPVRLEADLREIHFGRWEGLTREEIQARDPVLYEDWQSGAEGFEYPGGELRSAFRERVARGLQRILASPGHTAVCVLHKGVIREIVHQLSGELLAPGRPELGESIVLTRQPEDGWIRGQRSSNPPCLCQAA